MNKFDLIIVGAGPAGIFCALEVLRSRPDTKLLILEKGRIMRKCPKTKTEKCVMCNPCHISTGWGGAGAFSDGKLSLDPEVGGELSEYVKNVDDLIKYVDGIYLAFGGNPIVHYDEEFADKMAYEATKYSLHLIKCRIRHLGSEKSAEIMLKMYDEMKSYPNVIIKELTSVSKVLLSPDRRRVNGVEDSNGEQYFASEVVVGVGRNGSGWFSKVCGDIGVEVTDKDIDIGVRVEVPRSITDYITDRLYEIKLIHWKKNKVRTFCMNPGGFVSQENYDDNLAVVNGHSYQDIKSPNTNFALLTSLKLTEPFKDSITFGKTVARLVNYLTDGRIMVQRLDDLKLGRRSTEERISKTCTVPTLKDAVPGDIGHAYSPRVIEPILSCLEAMENLCPGINGKDTLLYAPEVKFYSSKVKVDNNLMTEIDGLYAIGDGAGITRGLMQASVSGVIAARHILSN